MEGESDIPRFGNPDSVKSRHALINEGNASVSLGGLQFLGAVVNDSTITDTGQMLFQNALLGHGTLALGTDAAARLFAGSSTGQTVDFTGVGIDLELHTPQNFLGKIAGFGSNDAIDLRVTAADSLSYSGGTLTVTEGASIVGDLKFAGSYSANNFALSSDTAGAR